MIAEAHGLSPVICSALGEMRVGDWEGMTLDDLRQSPTFHQFNQSRSTVRPPGGELMLETQTRMVTQLERLHLQHPSETVAIVSHGDPIRSTLAYYLGIPLDFIQRLEIDTASVSQLERSESGTRVLYLNHTVETPQ